jgi:hypothetical protein
MEEGEGMDRNGAKDTIDTGEMQSAGKITSGAAQIPTSLQMGITENERISIKNNERISIARSALRRWLCRSLISNRSLAKHWAASVTKTIVGPQFLKLPESFSHRKTP